MDATVTALLVQFQGLTFAQVREFRQRQRANDELAIRQHQTGADLLDVFVYIKERTFRNSQYTNAARIKFNAFVAAAAAAGVIVPPFDLFFAQMPTERRSKYGILSNTLYGVMNQVNPVGANNLTFIELLNSVIDYADEVYKIN